MIFSLQSPPFCSSFSVGRRSTIYATAPLAVHCLCNPKPPQCFETRPLFDEMVPFTLSGQNDWKIFIPVTEGTADFCVQNLGDREAGGDRRRGLSRGFHLRGKTPGKICLWLKGSGLLCSHRPNPFCRNPFRKRFDRSFLFLKVKLC